MDSNKTQHTVIDALDKTRQEHPHQANYSTGPLSHAVGNDVTDEILEQSEAVHIPKDDDSSSNNNNNHYSVDNKDNKGKLMGLSTSATLPSSTWQPLASKSTNQLPAANVLASVHGYGAQDRHDKPSVLPEILPGFKDRMADIHHATLKSVADVSPSSGAGGAGGGGGGGGEGGKWSGGTMFPAMTTGFMNPFGGGSVSQQHNQHQHVGSATEDANRRIARSSILYESSDLEESTTKLTDDDEDDHNDYQRSSITPPGAGERRPSSTLVQGGQGGRRWSHELSPEKAGLVGSVLSVAGLVKDVVLDKIQQHPPTTPPSTQGHKRRRLTAEEKQLAANAAFERSAASTLDVISGVAITTTASPSSTRGVEADQVLRAAPSAGQEHQKSIFHLAGNPETKKSLLLNHPESLGYHNVTKEQQQQQGMEDSILSGLGAQHQRNAASEQDVSKTRR
ncbi:hypothetical protein BGX24_011673 [Mortierella sp. AD032]|nr:hypothetical protein BGX24_011673 [Mortierella sp. AD032]